MSWYYNNELITTAPEEYVGFVYEIHDLHNGKKYIGKKWFWSTRKRPPLKGKTRKRIIKSESDWQDYFGSSDEVKLLVEESGRQRFVRSIIRLCKNKGECTYFEAKVQFERDVLLSDDYYNEFIGCKIHSKHVSTLRDDSS